ncbi:MAG: antitoxin [Gammaproteobacteria bacterium]|nr:antitoxin [Gammaproteobacteria bacterium]
MTIDIPAPILKELKEIQKTEGGSLGSLVSSLLADALTRHRAGSVDPDLNWNTEAMQARVDLTDKEAMHALFDVRPN